MTENEAIRILGDTTLFSTLGQAAFVGIEAIKKLQQYRAIGTVEECREAVEKQRAINPTFVLNFGDFESLFACECGKKITVRHNRGVMDNHDGPKFCSNCGIRWDWSDTP